MVLSDTKIKELMQSGVLENAQDDNVGPVSCDLTTKAFYTSAGKSGTALLNPGDSVFVASREIIHLPDNLTARVLLKNSRIRQGLDLEAPLYFPGHETVIYYRVTNISADTIELDATRGIAQITFEPVEGVVEHPYAGTFNQEFEFRGMANYSNIYQSEMRKIDSKTNEVLGIEKRMYANVLALMAIFAAIFTLVNVNVQALSADSPLILTVNLATIGSFAFLVGLIALVIKPREKVWYVVPFALAIAAFVAAAVYA